MLRLFGVGACHTFVSVPREKVRVIELAPETMAVPRSHATKRVWLSAGGEKEPLREAVRACVQHNVCCCRFILHSSSCVSRAMKCGECCGAPSPSRSLPLSGEAWNCSAEACRMSMALRVNSGTLLDSTALDGRTRQAGERRKLRMDWRRELQKGERSVEDDGAQAAVEVGLHDDGATMSGRTST